MAKLTRSNSLSALADSEKCELRKIPEIFARYAALFLSRIHYLRQVAGALALAHARRLPV